MRVLPVGSSKDLTTKLPMKKQPPLVNSPHLFSFRCLLKIRLVCGCGLVGSCEVSTAVRRRGEWEKLFVDKEKAKALSSDHTLWEERVLLHTRELIMLNAMVIPKVL